MNSFVVGIAILVIIVAVFFAMKNLISMIIYVGKTHKYNKELEETGRYCATAIVAVDANTGGIGFKGKIPWKSKSDMSFFKMVTTANFLGSKNILICGRSTYDSFGDRYLSGRDMVVLTTKPLAESGNASDEVILPNGAEILFKRDGMKVYTIGNDFIVFVSLVDTIKEAIDTIRRHSFNKYPSVFVIGGSKIYDLFISSDGKNVPGVYVNSIMVSIIERNQVTYPKYDLNDEYWDGIKFDKFFIEGGNHLDAYPIDLIMDDIGYELNKTVGVRSIPFADSEKEFIKTLKHPESVMNNSVRLFTNREV